MALAQNASGLSDGARAHHLALHFLGDSVHSPERGDRRAEKVESKDVPARQVEGHRKTYFRFS